MSALTVDQVLENIYASLFNNNENIDAHIAQLKEALAAANEKVAVADPSRLVQPNREGRKMMQSYFKKRGVIVEFAKKEA